MNSLVNLRLFTIAAAVGIIHLVTGLTLWLGHATYALHTTPMNLISVAFGSNPTIVGLVLVVTAIAALIPFFVPHKAQRRAIIALVFPQQVLLVLHFISIMGALVSGHYPDGYVPDGGSIFIFVDQIWLMTIIFWHTMEYWTTLT